MIRDAARHEIRSIVEMMREYADEAPVKVLQGIDTQDSQHVGNVIFTMMAGRGFVLVDDDLNGFIAAVIVPNIWSPKILELRELAWWVYPDCRNTSLGGKLWLAFNKRAQEMLDAGRVQMICVTSMASSPALDYTKRGYAPLETTYFREV